METEKLLGHVEAALAGIKHPAFFEDERSFQGELLVMLRKTIPDHVLPEGAVIQQEYQKRLATHGLRIRPDIIIHAPYDPSRHGGRDEGNFLVIALKRQASAAKAAEDFTSLGRMMDVLNYPAGVFINIASLKTHAEVLPPELKDRITCFAISRGDEGQITIRRD
ncbi:hypothetical protein J2W25_001583 [Variovorax boronicumulans]|uniref:Uncharacterized protein n=1 Tax=Variovorax boronicumulans TaxID=436515 RepID=A0AAW8DSR0_9BURK|nr:hypothetical protein [Variovorax boronicumulans]MDP9876555.1 hypothetical protein [Variovorax boronicumulans]MDP9922568.1 hypothetical protein [Variovorax boronicumulans]